MRARFSRLQMSDISYTRPELKREDDPVFWDRHHTDIAARAAQLEAQRVVNWPQSRQRAILMIARTDLALKVIAALNGTRAHLPRQHDFAALRNHHYASKNLGDRFHKLTPLGWKAAETAANILGKQLGLHHLTTKMDSFSEHRARCCCGWSASVNRRANTRATERLQRQYEEHLQNPDAWKLAGEASRKVIENLFPRRNEAIDIDDCVNVYGDGQAWPQIDTPCTSPKAPTGQCEFGADPAICIHCGRKT